MVAPYVGGASAGAGLFGDEVGAGKDAETEQFDGQACEDEAETGRERRQQRERGDDDQRSREEQKASCKLQRATPSDGRKYGRRSGV